MSATVTPADRVVVTQNTVTQYVGAGAQGPRGPIGETGLGGALGSYLSAYDTTDQPALAVSTPQRLNINTLAEAKTISLVDGGRIVFHEPGTYSFTFSIQFTNGENNVINRASVWLKYQDEYYPYSASHFDIPAFRNQKPGELVATVNFVASATGEDDWVEVWWEATSTQVKAETIESPNGIPDSPSVILTVTQVMYTQEGPQGPQGVQGEKGDVGDVNPDMPIILAATEAARDAALGAQQAAELAQTAAEDAADNAQSSETAASGFAQDAQDARDAAQGFAEDAQDQAEIAAVQAGDADDSAAAALLSAQTAAAQAGIATTKAGEASDSAAAALISAQEASAAAADPNVVAVGGDLLGANTIGTVAGIAADIGVVVVNIAAVQSAEANAVAAQAAADAAVGLINLAGATSIFVNQATVYGITNYNLASTYSVTVSAGSVSRSADKITFIAPATGQTVTMTVTKDGLATPFSIDVVAAGIETPLNVSPTNGQSGVTRTLTLSASAFITYGYVDTHYSSDWQVATDANFNTVVRSLSDNTENKTSWLVSALDPVQTYYWRVRYRGASGEVSDWSAATSFATRAILINDIGTPGTAGFGVGICDEVELPFGMSKLTGTEVATSDNYGNYQYSDGSVMVWVPAFYYKWGTGSNGIALNEVEIKNFSAYDSIAEANAAGYALHRAFYDGGQVKAGFFVDKYGCSNNSGVASSVKNGLPLSSGSAHNPFSGLNGAPTNALHGAITAAKTRGADFFCASIFIHKALALLSYAHGRASVSATYCAWWDPAGVTTFPKGNNINSAARCDFNDNSVKWESDGYNFSGKTGSAGFGGGTGNLFAKSTHNGQNCGVADLNGNMWEVCPGITTNGTTLYILKTSVAMKLLTAGNSTATDVWGATSYAANYDSLGTAYGAWWENSANRQVAYGNATGQVFSDATSGNAWAWAGAGGMLATGDGGTNPFGNDGFWDYKPNEMCPISGGGWSSTSLAGVWALSLTDARAVASVSNGFRSALYL